MRRWSLLVLVGVGILSVLPAGSLGAPSSGVQVLGAIIPLTGRFASGGAQVKAGYEIAAEDINARGGLQVGNRRVRLEIVMLDDESNPTQTVSRLETLAQQGVVGYLGGFGSDLHAAAAAVAEKNKIPYCGVAFALHQVTGYRHWHVPVPQWHDSRGPTPTPGGDLRGAYRLGKGA